MIDMPELGTIENGQATSLAGLAPIARQSGSWTGRAFSRVYADSAWNWTGAGGRGAMVIERLMIGNDWSNSRLEDLLVI